MVPLDLQPKLLRVLNSGEFEPLGSARIIRVDVRWIAASRHDLAKPGPHRLRKDLYNQLNATTLRVPSLRERREDIPSLVRYFVQTFARRMNKRIATVPTETMNVLMKSDWPGNVTELEGFIQRAVICRGVYAACSTHGAVTGNHLLQLQDKFQPRACSICQHVFALTLTSRSAPDLARSASTDILQSKVLPEVTSMKLSTPKPRSETLPATAPEITATSPSRVFHAIVKYSSRFPRRPRNEGPAQFPP